MSIVGCILLCWVYRKRAVQANRTCRRLENFGGTSLHGDNSYAKKIKLLYHCCSERTYRSSVRAFHLTSIWRCCQQHPLHAQGREAAKAGGGTGGKESQQEAEAREEAADGGQVRRVREPTEKARQQATPRGTVPRSAVLSNLTTEKRRTQDGYLV